MPKVTWPRLAPLGPAWPRLAPLGPAWPRLAPLGPAWPRLAPLGLKELHHAVHLLPPRHGELPALVLGRSRAISGDAPRASPLRSEGVQSEGLTCEVSEGPSNSSTWSKWSKWANQIGRGQAPIASKLRTGDLLLAAQPTSRHGEGVRSLLSDV